MKLRMSGLILPTPIFVHIRNITMINQSFLLKKLWFLSLTPKIRKCIMIMLAIIRIYLMNIILFHFLKDKITLGLDYNFIAMIWTDMKDQKKKMGLVTKNNLIIKRQF